MSNSEKHMGFWKNKRLEEMTPSELELLCDKCGRCCLHKVEYEAPREVYYTNIACRYLDEETCLCREYERAAELVPDCLKIRAEDVRKYFWLPKTCAYRLIAEGRDLKWWHELIFCDPESVHRAGISVRGKVVKEADVSENELENHIIDWVK